MKEKAQVQQKRVVTVVADLQSGCIQASGVAESSIRCVDVLAAYWQVYTAASAARHMQVDVVGERGGKRRACKSGSSADAHVKEESRRLRLPDRKAL